MLSRIARDSFTLEWILRVTIAVSTVNIHISRITSVSVARVRKRESIGRTERTETRKKDGEAVIRTIFA